MSAIPNTTPHPVETKAFDRKRFRMATNDDIEAAARGLNMRSLQLGDAELRILIARHAPQVTMFASQVIACAARKVLAERGL